MLLLGRYPLMNRFGAILARSIGTVAVGAAFTVFCLPGVSWATLGGSSGSIDSDQTQMQGTRRTIAGNLYTIHEITAATGTVVREFVSLDGTVFAVAWQGPRVPDLRQLLGSYFEPYAQAAQMQGGARAGRRPMTVNQTGLVVQAGGRIRAFTGRAYVPQMLPAGVKLEEIQ